MIAKLFLHQKRDCLANCCVWPFLGAEGGGSGGKRGGDCTDYFQTQHFSCWGLAAIFSTREKEQWNVNASTLCTILVFLLFWWEFSLQLFSPRLRNFEYCIEWNVMNITRHVHTPYSSDGLRILNFIHLLYTTPLSDFLLPSICEVIAPVGEKWEGALVV